MEKRLKTKIFTLWTFGCTAIHPQNNFSCLHLKLLCIYLFSTEATAAEHRHSFNSPPSMCWIFLFFFPQTEVTHPDAPALGMTADRSAQWSSTAATLTTTSSPKPPTVTQRSAPYTSAMVG